jgi:hypothetical protein
VVPDNYGQYWTVLDSNSNYAYWSHEWSGGDLRTSSYRWGASDGVQSLALAPEDDEEDIDLFFSLVSKDGGTVFGASYSDAASVGGFRWTREAGMSPLDFEPTAMTPDARIAVGFRDGMPVRWLEGVGATEIDAAWYGVQPPVVDRMTLSVGGDVVVGVGYFSGRSFRWTAATGSTELPRLARAPSKTLADYASQDGHVIAGTAGTQFVEVTRAFRWTEANGLQDLGDLPGAPEGADAQVTGLSGDGSTVVGQVQSFGTFSHPFVWTEATGMQDIVPGDRIAYINYVSPNGAVVIGFFLNEAGSASGGFRWTQATGAVDVGYTTPLGIGADGDLLVGNTLEGPFIETFGRLAGTRPLLARLTEPSPGAQRLVRSASRWRVPRRASTRRRRGQSRWQARALVDAPGSI